MSFVTLISLPKAETDGFYKIVIQTFILPLLPLHRGTEGYTLSRGRIRRVLLGWVGLVPCSARVIGRVGVRRTSMLFQLVGAVLALVVGSRVMKK